MTFTAITDGNYDDNRHQGWRKMCIDHIVDLKPLLEKKSVLLFGPRQTGKSSYIKTSCATV